MSSLLLASLLLAGCASPAANQAAAAAINTAIAGGVAAERRREGDCYTPCTPGNVCNPKTGYCDPLPCKGECTPDQVCDERGLIPHCVSTATLEVKQAKDPSPPPPADVPAR